MSNPRRGAIDPFSLTFLGFLVVSLTLGVITVFRNSSFDIRQRAQTYPPYRCTENQCVTCNYGETGCEYENLSACSAECKSPPPPPPSCVGQNSACIPTVDNCCSGFSCSQNQNGTHSCLAPVECPERCRNQNGCYANTPGTCIPYCKAECDSVGGCSSMSSLGGVCKQTPETNLCQTSQTYRCNGNTSEYCAAAGLTPVVSVSCEFGCAESGKCKLATTCPAECSGNCNSDNTCKIAPVCTCPNGCIEQNGALICADSGIGVGGGQLPDGAACKPTLQGTDCASGVCNNDPATVKWICGELPTPIESSSPVQPTYTGECRYGAWPPFVPGCDECDYGYFWDGIRSFCKSTPPQPESPQTSPVGSYCGSVDYCGQHCEKGEYHREGDVYICGPDPATLPKLDDGTVCPTADMTCKTRCKSGAMSFHVGRNKWICGKLADGALCVETMCEDNCRSGVATQDPKTKHNYCGNPPPNQSAPPEPENSTPPQSETEPVTPPVTPQEPEESEESITPVQIPQFQTLPGCPVEPNLWQTSQCPFSSAFSHTNSNAYDVSGGVIEYEQNGIIQHVTRDIAGAPVFAAFDGFIVFYENSVPQGTDQTGYGNSIVIEQADPNTGEIYYLIYGHLLDVAPRITQECNHNTGCLSCNSAQNCNMSDTDFISCLSSVNCAKKKRVKITAGTLLGWIDSTGYSTNNHLHIERIPRVLINFGNGQYRLESQDNRQPFELPDACLLQNYCE